MRRINADVDARALVRDCCSLWPDEIGRELGDASLLVMATDHFPAQAWGNRVAMRQGIPAVFIGMYRHARAAEVIYWCPGVTPACFRCITLSRYRAFARGALARTGSEGGHIMALRLVDAVAGFIGLGLLARGSDTPLGCLIDKLGDRNLLQIKIDPDYRLGDRDIFAEHLGAGPANFA